MRKPLAITVALLAGLLALGWTQRERILMRVPGIVGRILDPVGDNVPVTWAPGPSEPAPGPRAPNIVVIVADDLGYNDLTFGGGGVAGGAVPTPNIDGIARAGVEYTRGYSGNATCAPSRAAILTGRYPTRFGFEFTPVPKPFARLIAWMRRNEAIPPLYFEEREAAVPPVAEQGLPPSEITLAELLRGHGYHTLGLGKWHLGEAAHFRPEAQGFDEYLGFLSGASLYLEHDDPGSVSSRQSFDPIDQFLWANLAFAVRKDGGPRFAPDAYLTDYLAREAARAIAANRNRPFFLYLAFNAPHTPLQALRSDYDALPQIESHTLRTYAAMIRALDRGVGDVLQALRANGLEENTLVIFTSDNGAPEYVGLPDLNEPYRGWKMTFFEGGVRTPLFAKWPARLPAGERFHTPATHVDIFATAAGAASAPLPTDRAVDGVDLVRLARGEAQGRPHGAIFWRSGHYRVILADDWKLQVSERPKRTWLFDLSADPTERNDLSAARPDKLRELAAILAEHEAQMILPAWPALIEGPIAIDHTLAEPLREGEEYVYWAN
ncbi:MAG TPA: sulfatase-like hydrolase/transferase [Myxococcota bacterium]|nr:sulfatase-like hydrolase/transferase [Myxococcota bacterium]